MLPPARPRAIRASVKARRPVHGSRIVSRLSITAPGIQAAGSEDDWPTRRAGDFALPIFPSPATIVRTRVRDVIPEADAGTGRREMRCSDIRALYRRRPALP